jgi:hypothetical protein
MNVKEVFAGLEKLRRVRRGRKPKSVWIGNGKVSLVSLLSKLSERNLDITSKEVNNNHGKYSLHRAIYASSSKFGFGYLCVRSIDYEQAYFASYTGLQDLSNRLEGDIRWFSSFNELIQYLEAHCTSKAYVSHIKELKV